MQNRAAENSSLAQLEKDLRLTQQYPLKSWVLPVLATFAAYELTRQTTGDFGAASIVALVADICVSTATTIRARNAFRRLIAKAGTYNTKLPSDQILSRHMKGAAAWGAAAGLAVMWPCLLQDSLDKKDIIFTDIPVIAMSAIALLTFSGFVGVHIKQLEHFITHTVRALNLVPGKTAHAEDADQGSPVPPAIAHTKAQLPPPATC